MSVAYASTSFGTSTPARSASPTRNQSRSVRHQRQASSSSGSSGATLAVPFPTNGQSMLPPTVTAPSSTQSYDSARMMHVQYDQIGAFFGARPAPAEISQRSMDSGSTLEHVHDANTGRVPPPYDSRSDIESLPTYSKAEEYDAQLNRNLFIYGFLFFPLWIVGIIAPFVRPSRDPAKDNRSKEDQEADYANMRAIEMRWALRCGIALVSFITLVIVAVVVGVTVANHE